MKFPYASNWEHANSTNIQVFKKLLKHFMEDKIANNKNF